MKDILIVIHGMGCGGAEKSLISFLTLLPERKWNIDLVVANPHGMLMDKIPENINILNDLYELENFSTPFWRRRKKICNIKELVLQIEWKVQSPKLLKEGKYTFGELRWKLWGRKLPELQKEYDLAVSYMNGFTNYYVMDKVKAKRKILWVHNEFEKLGYNYEFEYPFYKEADAVITISESCRKNVLRIYPDLENKVFVLENISPTATIRKMIKPVPEDIYFVCKKKRLLSVGRLTEQKAFNLAIQAARILVENKKDFIWYILGEGELRDELESMIKEYNLERYVKLAGVKSNPYPYIANCDIFIQPSKYEGKSIALDEAKILCRPIVVTNYDTVYNSIKDGVNGIISEMSGRDLAGKIQMIMDNCDLRNALVKKLKEEHNGNEEEIYKYIELFEKVIEK